MIKRILMCRPEYYEIEYSINNWTDSNMKINLEKAIEQWENLYSTLVDLEVEVSLLEPIKGIPDLCFTGDAGMVYNNKFLCANFRNAERQPEVVYYLNWMDNNGYQIHNIPNQIPFEGLGDVVQFNNNYFFGYGERSVKEALVYVKKVYPELNLLGSLEIINTNFFHNSHAIALLSEDLAMIYPGAYSKETLEMIKSSVKNYIEIDKEDAENFVCNNIVIGNKILLDDCSMKLHQTLTSYGFDVIKLPMSEFKKTGASLRCLVLPI